jgi:phage shock protein A
MPPTVKSLEERIDEMADEFSAVRTQLAVVLNNQSSSQTQMATLLSNNASSQAQAAMLLAKLDGVLDQLKLTNGRLEEVARSQESLKTDHTAVKVKSETTFGLLRWAGVTGAGVFLTVILAAFSVVRAAGHLENKVDQHEKILEQMRHDLNELHAKPK